MLSTLLCQAQMDTSYLLPHSNFTASLKAGCRTLIAQRFGEVRCLPVALRCLISLLHPCLWPPQPVTNHNPWMLLYFISFLLIVSFFVLNMFVGVVVENFHKCRQHQEEEEARRREEKRLRRLEKKRRSKEKQMAGR